MKSTDKSFTYPSAFRDALDRIVESAEDSISGGIWETNLNVDYVIQPTIKLTIRDIRAIAKAKRNIP
jgi:hypothetical protein